jgi:HD-GYP domain-containing protein (c-di-GMP phosphodiesterase class II)
MRLFKAILLLMLVASVVPITMVGLLSASHTRELLVRDTQELSGERVRQLRLKTEAVLGEPTRAVLGLARVPSFFDLSAREQRSYIAAVLNQRRDVTAITLFSASGERLPGVQAFADIPPTEVARHEELAKKLLPEATTLRYSEVTVGNPDGQPAVTLAFPVGDPVKGFVAAQISLAGLTQMLRVERVGSKGVVYITDSQGRLVVGPELAAHTGDDLSGRPAVRDFIETFKRSPDSEIFRVGNFGPERERLVGAYTVVPEAGWSVISEEPIANAYAPVAAMERVTASAWLVSFGVALLLAAVFSKSVTRPLKGFTQSAMEIARGKFGTQFTTKARNELGELAQTFNYMSQQLLAYDQETRGLYDSLEKGYLETIVALANSIDSKDSYTRGHSQRVGDTAVEIGRELGLSERELKDLRYGGILHDIGKIGITESILLKKSQLTPEEMSLMREHPVIGDTIIAPVTLLKTVRSAVRHHHERWDGNGYPDRLRGEQIPLVARVVACADTFDACTSTRPYQQAMSVETAMGIMDRLSGASLDPKIVDALHRAVRKKGVAIEGHASVKLAS